MGFGWGVIGGAAPLRYTCLQLSQSGGTLSEIHLPSCNTTPCFALYMTALIQLPFQFSMRNILRKHAFRASRITHILGIKTMSMELLIRILKHTSESVTVLLATVFIGIISFVLHPEAHLYSNESNSPW